MKNTVLLLILIGLTIGLSYFATYAERNNGIPDVFAILFPEHFVDQEALKARETQTAPFAAEENAAQPVELHPDIVYDPLGESVNITESLDVVHLNEANVSKWITEAVTEVMTFEVSGFEDHKTKIAKFMSENGFHEYETFIDTTNILRMMQSGNLDVRAFVVNIPELKGAGEAGGRYRWVYDVPVNLTFLPVGTTNYRSVQETGYRTESLIFRIQLGRVKEGLGRDGIAIETWAARR